MLRVNNLSQPASVDQTMPSGGFEIATYVKIAQRQWPTILAVTLPLVMLALIYVLTAQPKFTAYATLLIDTRKNQLLSSQQQVVGDQVFDSTGVESQVEILKSDSIALAVIRDLKLVDDPIFADGGLIRSIINLFGSDEPATPAEKEQATVAAFERNLQIKRVGLTYAIEISYTSTDAAKSAAIANAIADAYTTTELESRYEATKRASKWLQDRIRELREQATVAEAEVQKFRSDNNIIDTGRGLLTEQQLGDVNAQLVSARAATAEAKARLDRINQLSKEDIPNATVTDALRDDVITRLRAQYLDLSARQADFSNRYGATHASVQNLVRQMTEIRRSIRDEVNRIAETYKSEYEIARTREKSLQDSLASLVTSAGTTGQAQVKLRDLTSSAQTNRNLYDTFLQRFMEATQQQNFPVTDARLISAATPPKRKSSPKTIIIVPGALALGLLLGFAAALGREKLGARVFRTAADVESETQVECLGILPNAARLPAAPIPATAGLLRTAMARQAVDAPFSRFSESLRAVKVAADISAMNRQSRVIGIVSALPNEGKTTVVANLAGTIAASGRTVLVIDGDLRNPSLTRLLAPEAREGLIEVLSGSRSVADVTQVDSETGFRLLPAVLNKRMWQTAELLSSEAMASVFEAARRQFDYVLIDLPPVLPVVDVRAVSSMIDCFVMVVEWNKTSRQAVAEALDGTEFLRDRLLGVILNKASPAQLQRLEGYKGAYYTSYYHERPEAA